MPVSESLTAVRRIVIEQQFTYPKKAVHRKHDIA